MDVAQTKGLAIIAGAGDLPRLLAEDCKRRNHPYCVVGFGNAALKWAVDHPLVTAQFEKPAKLFGSLKDAGCDAVVFAGGMARPHLNPLKFDWKFLKIAPSLLPALKSGDDVTLRAITSIFESEGFAILGADQILADLVAKEGIPTQAKPNETDAADIQRAIQIVRSLGQVDVGQGAVVAGGVCIGLESIQGTDAMLDFVALHRKGLETSKTAQGGVLVKAAKPGQDRRVDLPSIGPKTFEMTHKAGLNGVAVFAGSSLILGQDETCAMADRLGLFLQILGDT